MKSVKMKLYISLVIVAIILSSIYYVSLNKNTRIYSNEDNIEFFEIYDYQLTKEFLKSTEFTENILDNIEKNIDLNIDSENIIVIDKPVDEIKYIPYKVYLSEDGEAVEKISSYYGIVDKSGNKTEDNFYIEGFTIENNKETHFVNSFNPIIYSSSYYPNVKIYFVKVDNKYLIFSINA